MASSMSELNSSAYSLGQIVGGGSLKETEVFEALMRAAKDVKLDCENDVVTRKATMACKATIDSGLQKGKQQPRKAPENRTAPKNAVKASDANSENLTIRS